MKVYQLIAGGGSHQYIFSSYDKALNFYCKRYLNHIRNDVYDFIKYNFDVWINTEDLILPIPSVNYTKHDNTILTMDDIHTFIKSNKSIMIKIPIESIEEINLKPNIFYKIESNNIYNLPYKYDSKSDFIKACNILIMLRENYSNNGNRLKHITLNTNINIDNCKLFIKELDIEEFTVDEGYNELKENENEVKYNKYEYDESGLKYNKYEYDESGLKYNRDEYDENDYDENDYDENDYDENKDNENNNEYILDEDNYIFPHELD